MGVTGHPRRWAMLGALLTMSVSVMAGVRDRRFALVVGALHRNSLEET